MLSKVMMTLGRCLSVSHTWKQAIGLNGHGLTKDGQIGTFNPLNKGIHSPGFSRFLLFSWCFPIDPDLQGSLIPVSWHLPTWSMAHQHKALMDCNQLGADLDLPATQKEDAGHWLCFQFY